MNEIELNKEFEKFKEILDSIITVEYGLDHFMVTMDSVIYPLEKLKFICLKNQLLEVDEIENLSNLNKEELYKFCDELKKMIKNDFLGKLKDEGLEIKFNSEEKFFDIYDYIMRTNVALNTFSDRYFELVIFQVDKLKFTCLKYQLLEIDEIENLDHLNKEELYKFCDELEDDITNEFIDSFLTS